MISMEDNLQSQNCINKGRPVYFSYARNSSRKAGWEHISDCVDKILATFREQNIEYRVDTKDIGAGDSISDFEREIGWNSEVVILIISDKYFRSLHCLYEFLQIKKAFKQHPEKHLICIKSGDVNLSDINYIMELAHNMGDLKQEYDTIEYHHLRNHSGTEDAAYANGFYIDDIRELGSFFNELNFYDGSSDDWNALADEITDYYTKSKKSFIQTFKEKKTTMSKMKAFGCGFAALTSIVLISFFAFIYLFISFENTVDYPQYIENSFFDNEETFTNITKYTLDRDGLTLYFHSVNLTDDTMRRVEIDTINTKVIEKIVIWRKTRALKEVCGINGQTIPEYYPGGAGTSVDYAMKFEPIFGCFEFDYIQNDGWGIFDLNYRNNQSYQLPYLIWLKKLFNRDYHYNNNNSTTIEHPELTCDYTELSITKIEMASDETVVFMRYINFNYVNDTICLPRNSYLLANGVKHKLTHINGATIEPFVTVVPKQSVFDFAMIFEPIKSNKNNPIDLAFDEEDSTGFYGLKVNRKNIISLDNPIVTGAHLGNTTLTKVDIDSNETILYFKVVNMFKKQSMSIRAYKDSYIMAGDNKYAIRNSVGIIPDATTIIPAGCTLDYALFFPPIPPDTKTLDFINKEYSRKELGEQKYNEIIDMFGDEYANESGDKISTGIFGIRIQ